MKDYNMNLDLDVMLGPNTKQYWIYDNTNDVFIDPPKQILDFLNENYKEDEIEDQLYDIISEKPEWLFETDFWYDGEDVEI